MSKFNEELLALIWKYRDNHVPADEILSALESAMNLVQEEAEED